MSAPQIVLVAPEVAKAALRESAITEIPDEDDVAEGCQPQTVIHTFVSAGSMLIGADWDLDSAITFVDHAEINEDRGGPLVAWVNGQYPLHELVVVARRDGELRQIAFQVSAPEGTFGGSE